MNATTFMIFWGLVIAIGVGALLNMDVWPIVLISLGVVVVGERRYRDRC